VLGLEIDQKPSALSVGIGPVDADIGGQAGDGGIGKITRAAGAWLALRHGREGNDCAASENALIAPVSCTGKNPSGGPQL